MLDQFSKWCRWLTVVPRKNVNGSLADPERHFHRLGLPRTAHVDSELLLRIAERHTSNTGLDIDGLLDDIEPLEGLIVMVSSRPDEVVLLKGNRPLEVRYHGRLKILAYASEAAILDAAFTQTGWQDIVLDHNEGLIVHAGKELNLERLEYRFGDLIASPGWTAVGSLSIHPREVTLTHSLPVLVLRGRLRSTARSYSASPTPRSRTGASTQAR